MSLDNIPMKRINDFTWEIPTSYKNGMKVPARIIATPEIKEVIEKKVIDQITNVATLPGVQNYSLALPDAHVGYGFPIGGVAAMDLEEGVISPGGIGFDINCGVRLLTTNLVEDEVRPKIKHLVEKLFQRVPAGVGVKGALHISKAEFEGVITRGSKWCEENGYATKEDVRHTENEGHLEQANPAAVSQKAMDRGYKQVGTLGSGNHFLEIQTLSENDVFDEKIAKQLNLTPGNVTIMIHCGSRGFGHQIGSDYLRSFLKAMKKYNIPIRDKELASAPIQSEEGQDYYAAMSCAANMAFANRQVITNNVREVLSEVFGKDQDELGIKLVYDVAHNIAKFEDHTINGEKRKVVVHRKGATRSFPPNHSEVPKDYQNIGQPVLIGGSMETGSYVLTGTQGSMDVSFGSTAHGAGRTMSRSQAKREVWGETLQKELREKGIYVKGASMAGLAEEAGIAYKDIDAVVKALKVANIGKPIVRLRPIGNIKG